KKSECKVSLSLSDSFCVERHREDFLNLIDYGIDIVFANESEIISIFKTPDLKNAISQCKEYKNIFAITCAEKGSVIVNEKEEIRIKACSPIKLVDTTGAGDMYAAGFLHGYLANRDLSVCGITGSILASEVIGQYGARFKKENNDILKVFKQITEDRYR
ncbi:MAG: adenosine kinase, partial [Actinomycetota bacterium]|nr:adenosine kinase [Actinomycetota bacterium]